jgi:hypothetical protein
VMTASLTGTRRTSPSIPCDPCFSNGSVRASVRFYQISADPASVFGFFFTARGRAADSSVALAFAVGRGYEATDAAKRLKFGASPTDGVAETGSSAPLEPELSLKPELLRHAEFGAEIKTFGLGY